MYDVWSKSSCCDVISVQNIHKKFIDYAFVNKMTGYWNWLLRMFFLFTLIVLYKINIFQCEYIDNFLLVPFVSLFATYSPSIVFHYVVLLD